MFKHYITLSAVIVATSLSSPASVSSDSTTHSPINHNIDFTDTEKLSRDTLDSLAHLTPDEIKTERLKNQHRVVYFGENPVASVDSLRHLIEMFYVDQFRHFQDPLAPYFLMMSRDAKLALGIGGAVRMRGWFDFDGAMPVNGFVPFMIPVPKDPAQKRRVGGTPGETAIFLRVIGRNKTLGDISGYIQIDFSGANNVTPKLKKAYATIFDWTIGYASTTFCDPQSDVPTIDGAGQNGRLSGTAMLIRYAHTFKDRWQLAASVELPHTMADGDNVNTKAINDWMPDYAAFVQYQWAHNSHVRLSGIIRTLPYRNLIAQKNKSVIGWGTQLSTAFTPARMITVYGAANIGRGYSSCMNDLSVGNYDLVGDPGNPGVLYAPMAYGLNCGIKYNFTNNIYSCIALGHSRYLPRNGVSPTDYKYGQYAAINFFWDMTTRLQVGAEYLIGRRVNFNHEHGSANRVDVLFQFSF